MDRRRVWEKVKEEFFAVLPPTLFFFVALHVVALIRDLMAKAVGIHPASTISIAVASLVLGKAVLIADMLPAINRYPDKPLIYAVAWKTTPLSGGVPGHPLPGATWSTSRARRAGLVGRQREAARGDRLAAFLGGADRPAPDSS